MSKNTTRKQVLGISAPARASDSAYHDKNCPFTGTLAVKNELLQGKVIRKDTSKSATIEWERSIYVPKYERYQTKRSRLRVHNPPALDAQIGDMVIVARTRPLSKTKNHVIVQVLSSEQEDVSSSEKKSSRKKSRSKSSTKTPDKKTEESTVEAVE